MTKIAFAAETCVGLPPLPTPTFGYAYELRCKMTIHIDRLTCWLLRQ